MTPKRNPADRAIGGASEVSKGAEASDAIVPSAPGRPTLLVRLDSLLRWLV